MKQSTNLQGPGTPQGIALPFALLVALLMPMTSQATEAAGMPTVSVTTPAPPLATEEWKPEEKRALPETGRSTRGWLQAQGHREQASANRPTLSGPALRRSHDRYLRTFEVDIPQQLRESLPTNK